MGIFGGGSNANSPTKLANIRITRSVQGDPHAVILGSQRIQQSLLWLDGFTAKQESEGGKGGGKGGSFYLYAADVLAALCNGPVVSIGNVWSGQSWLNNSTAHETVTVQVVYAPSSAAYLVADNGVGLACTYSQSFTDYGAPAATVLSGSDLAPMTQVPYGTALSAGEYSVNPASIGTFALTAVANASGGNTVYTGTFTGGTAPYTSGASNAYIGFAFVVKSFTNAVNDGTFVCVASSATSVTLANASGVAETHAATAAETGNTYHFSSADVGKTAQISYQFSLQYLEAEELDIIPSGKTITVGQPFYNGVDMGAAYYNPGGPNDGVALTSVPTNPPTVTGTYHFISSGSTTNGNKYIFATGDINSEVRLKFSYQDNANVGQDAPTTLNFELIGGGQSQAPWSVLASSYPQAALGYTKTAMVAYAPMSLGDSAEIQDNTFEVLTPDAYGSGIVDCNPVQCIFRVLTDSTWGLGSGMMPFPISCIDNGATGTWGGPSGTPGARTTASTAWNWFAAQSFFISPIMDAQDTAASVIGKWLEAGMCSAFMSEGLLKLVPYGDTSAAGNGCTWTAPQNFIVALDDTCFAPDKEGADPVKISRKAWQDAYNECQVQWNNRANQYAPEITPEFDQAAINRYGLRIEDPQDWDFITTLPAATFAANLRVKRGVNIRNEYTFTLPYTCSYLEPMDIVPITTSSVWAAGLNNTNLGVVNLPLRIQRIVDDPKTGLEITAEDYPWGTHQPVLFNKSISAGNTAVNTFADPGDTEVVMFEATNRLTGYAGNEIWIGAVGASDNWGSCNVWVSQDGTKYLPVGTINSPARMGVLNATFASGSDPDTVNSLVVNMVENSSALEAGTSTDADSGNTLCFADGEIIAYSACTTTGQDQYTLGTYIRRGQMGSAIASHAANSLFLRLDNSVFKYTYDPTWAGKTLYFKFQSVNSFNQSAQPLSSLTAVSFTVPGLNPGTIDASTGLVIGAAAGQGQCPASLPTTITASLSSGGLTSSWTAGNAVVLPGTVEFDVFSTGGIVDVLLWASNDGSSKPNGYMLRFDGRVSFVAGQVLKITSGAWSNIDTSKAAANSGALTGWHHVKAQIGNGQMDVFVDGIYCATAIDRTYTPTGATYYGYEVSSGASVAPTGMTTKSIDNVPDGTTYARVQGTALTASGNVDPTKAGVLMKGSIPPSINGGFTYTATTSSITWSWPANTAVYRADGTVSLIGAGSQAVTGLSLNRAYYFYPVYNEATSTLKFIASSDVTFPSLVGYTGDGTTGYVSTATAVSQPGNFSIECWVNTTSSSVQPLFDLSAPQVLGTAGNKSFTMWFQGSTITAVALLGSSVITTLASVSATAKLNDGNTHHIVLTWDNTAHACVVYVDGVLQTNSVTPASAFTALSTMFWHIGGVNGKASWTLTSNTFATASISNAAFYNAVLSATQVSNHYQAMLNISVAQYNTIVAADSPIYWWKLNETTGTSAADSAGSNTGTYKGTVTLNVSNEAYGANGSPSIAWSATSYLTVQASVLQGNIPLTSGSISAAATSGGSGGGGGIGGGVGGGGCFSPNTMVKTERGDVRFDELTLSDKVLTANGTWRPIAKILIHDWTRPMLNMGDDELITYKHHVLDDVWVAGVNVFGGSKPYSGKVWNLEVETDEPEGFALSPRTEHSYTLGNGWVVHNGPVGTK